MINVFVEYKKNKNLYLKIKKREIHCSAPFDTPDEIIKIFVDKHIKNFAKELEKVENNLKYSLTYDFLYFKGKKYHFQRLAGFVESTIEIYNNKMYIKTSDSSDVDVKIAIKNFLVLELQKYLETNLFD
jgi:predicted metal-dependent hydrolase